MKPTIAGVCPILLIVFVAASLFAQAASPSYIAEFPMVDKVMTGMKTADPDQTAARQMASHYWLMNMIVEMAARPAPIRRRGPE